jgi:MFS transporter, BCD family, chlorophyll transporter
LVQVIQGSAVATLVLNACALWKQEALKRSSATEAETVEPSFGAAWATYMQGEHALRRLVMVGFGTMAFGMQDVLLEPYGGEILHLSVSATTVLTATLAVGGLLGFGWASHVLTKGADAFRMSGVGAFIGALAFLAIIVSAPFSLALLFKIGVFFLGFGGGLFSHGTLTATMNSAPKSQAGLALGAWGAVQATAGGIGIGTGGVIRDLVTASPLSKTYGEAIGYNAVYTIEIVLLLATLVALTPLMRGTRIMQPAQP